MNTWVNGREGGTLDPRDRGLQYGDGVFETMRIRRGVIRLLDYHLERLDEACHRLSLRAAPARVLRGELRRIAAERSEGVLKLIVTRGVGARGYRPSGRERGTRVVSLHSLSRGAVRAALGPVELRLCTLRLGSNPLLAGLKTLNRLESVLARAEWSDNDIWEGLLRDADDNIVSGTMTNVFIRRDRLLMTPDLDRCGIAGVMRRWVLEQAKALAYRPRIGRLDWNDVAGADEVFLTNAVVGVVPVGVLHRGRDRVRFAAPQAATALRSRLESQ